MKIFILSILFFVTIFCRAQTFNIYTVAGTGIPGYTGDGSAATNAEMDQPSGIALDKTGNLYIADASNNVIRMVNTTGVIQTVIGTGTSGYTGDGGPATAAEIDVPVGVFVDKIDNIYLGDQINFCVREVNTSGIINTIAGNNTPGYSGNGVPATAAQITGPCGIIMDNSNNLFIADEAACIVRKVNTSGIIFTIAGNGGAGYTGDGGPATAAEFNQPSFMAMDASGNYYIADAGNNCIRKINTSGIISTFAGTGSASYSGDGGLATAAHLNTPTSIAFDASGNAYIADYSNARIRMVNTSGIINTIAGTGSVSYTGDGGPATAATMNQPYDIKVDASGNIYFSDFGNNCIRVLTKTTGLDGITSKIITSIYPNPSQGQFNLDIDNGKPNNGSHIEIYNITGENIYSAILTSNHKEINLQGNASGIYIYQITSEKGEFVASGKLIIL